MHWYNLIIRRCLLLLCFLALLWISVPAAAQEDDRAWSSLLEQWAEQNESETVPDDVVEQLQEFLENPININDTLSDELSLLPFLTDFQRTVIRAYITQNGPMASPNELFLLNGFDSVTLQLLLPFVCTEPVDATKHLTLRQMLHDGRSNLRIGSKTVRPLSRAYNEDIYEGSPFRLYFRYKFSYGNRLSLQLSGDKDAGESFHNQSPIPGFDYYGYHLMFNDFGIVRRAIVGKYQLQFGQGATLWSGYAPWMTGSMPLWRYGQGIRPASAFCEYGYLRGAATTLRIIPSLELTLFYSHVRRDATESSYGDDSILCFQSIYNSGYHRTENEISKEDRLTEQLFGGHLQYREGNLSLGATAFHTQLANPLIPVSYPYNIYAFSGQRLSNGGVDFTYRIRRLLLFGEAAVSADDSSTAVRRTSGLCPMAAVAGMQLHLNANNNISVAYRYGSPTYHNLHSNTIGQSSSTQNEEGVAFYFSTRLPFYILLQGSADFFRYPWMRYRVYSPSSGVEYRLLLSKELMRFTTLSCQYRYKASQRNSDGQLYSIEDIRRQQLQLSLDYDHNSWRLLSRAVFSLFDCDDHSSQHGLLLFQEATYRATRLSRPFSLGVRLALFNVSGYDARIYTYESDLMYEFAVPMLTGRGVRGYFIYRHELGPRLSVAFKYAVSYYPDSESIGSGYDLIASDRRHDIKVQMRYRF